VTKTFSNGVTVQDIKGCEVIRTADGELLQVTEKTWTMDVPNIILLRELKEKGDIKC
jgi:hypothetical protein